MYDLIYSFILWMMVRFQNGWRNTTTHYTPFPAQPQRLKRKHEMYKSLYAKECLGIRTCLPVCLPVCLSVCQTARVMTFCWFTCRRRVYSDFLHVCFRPMNYTPNTAWRAQTLTHTYAHTHTHKHTNAHTVAQGALEVGLVFVLVKHIQWNQSMQTLDMSGITRHPSPY